MGRTTRKRNDFSRTAKAPLRSQKVYFREWREYRDLSQAVAGDRIGVTGQTLSRIETGNIEFCEHHLEGMAAAYDCRIEDLLFRDPKDPEPFWRIWSRLRSEPNRRQATAILEAYVNTVE